ncbi:MAG: hypothetical protein AAFX01_06230 [Cyanobacteria bacterium J06638_28]
MSDTTTTIRWTTADLDALATDEWKRYEIIDRELFATMLPTFVIRMQQGKFMPNCCCGRRKVTWVHLF